MKREIIIIGKIFLGIILFQGYGQFKGGPFIYAEKRMVEVSVDAIEITETNLKELGIEWVDSFTFEEGSIPSLLDVDEGYELSKNVYDTYKIGKIFRTSPFVATLHVLINNNEARILANPKLVTESGTKAEFLVGGEVPYAYTMEDRLVIAWKKYGVSLNIKPFITGRQNITAEMEVGVKEIGEWISIGSFNLPSFTDRRAKSTASIKDGETLVIAGLRKTSRIDTKKKVPFLGYIPLIGELFFTYANVRDVRTSLVMFVTFNLVK